MKITAGFVLFVFASLSTAQDLPSSEARSILGPGGFLDSFFKKPLVTSSGLQFYLKSSNLVNHAKQFVKFSKLGGGHTRAFGSVGHNATLTYIKKLLDDTKYYDTSYQTFPYLFSEGSATFVANGTNYPTGWFTYGVSGDIEAPIVLVNNLGCSLVSIHHS